MIIVPSIIISLFSNIQTPPSLIIRELWFFGLTFEAHDLAMQTQRFLSLDLSSLLRSAIFSVLSKPAILLLLTTLTLFKVWVVGL